MAVDGGIEVGGTLGSNGGIVVTLGSGAGTTSQGSGESWCKDVPKIAANCFNAMIVSSPKEEIGELTGGLRRV